MVKLSGLKNKKGKNPTILVSEIILHALKYAHAVDYGKISGAKHIV